MSGDFFIDSLIELTVVDENVFYFFDLLDDEGVLLDERCHGYAPAYKLVIDGDKIV